MDIYYLFYTDQVDSALEIEEKLPIRIRRKFKLHSVTVKKDGSASRWLKLYYKVYDRLRKSVTFKVMEKEVNQLKDDEKLSNMLQGKEVNKWLAMAEIWSACILILMRADQGVIGVARKKCKNGGQKTTEYILNSIYICI